MNKEMVIVCGKSVKEIVEQVEIIKATRAMGATVGIGGSMAEIEKLLGGLVSSDEGYERTCCKCECECDEDEVLNEVLGNEVADLAMRMTKLDDGGLLAIENLLDALGI